MIADKSMLRRCGVIEDGMNGRIREITGETCLMVSKLSRSQSPRNTVRWKYKGGALLDEKASDPA
jgi:hypothetical protein